MGHLGECHRELKRIKSALLRGGRVSLIEFGHEFWLSIDSRRVHLSAIKSIGLATELTTVNGPTGGPVRSEYPMR